MEGMQSIACATCGEECQAWIGEQCQKSKRECGHHCNCSWTQDECCWCGKKFHEDEMIDAMMLDSAKQVD